MNRLRVDANGPFDHRAALAVLHTHRTEGVEHVDDHGVARLVAAGDDDHVVTVMLDTDGATVTVDTADAVVCAEVIERVRHWFDLDADVAAVEAVLAFHRMFTDHVRLRPGIRITRCADVFEAVVETVLGQQVTLAAARTFDARLVAAFGSDGPAGLRRFPRPADLVAVPVDDLRATLRVTGARARAVHAVAEFFVGRARGARLPDRDHLAAVYGIGPWTLDYLAVRAGADPDAFPENDAVLCRVMREKGGSGDDLAHWRPFRSYAAVRLWAMGAAGG